ncbi:MAG: hypothetical protein AB7O97_18885 [Planctomycetota bacterium]
MTKSAHPSVSAGPALTREPRAFSYLKPRLVTTEPPAIDIGGKAVLGAKANDYVPALARALVDHTIAMHNKRALDSGNRQPIQLSVLNRRRRAARAWIQAVLSGGVDLPTQHAVATQWLPTLAGHGREPELVLRTMRSCIEFLRGAIVGVLFDEPADNLLGHARALHVLETVLAVHLAAAQEALQ